MVECPYVPMLADRFEGIDGGRETIGRRIVRNAMSIMVEASKRYIQNVVVRNGVEFFLMDGFPGQSAYRGGLNGAPIIREAVEDVLIGLHVPSVGRNESVDARKSVGARESGCGHLVPLEAEGWVHDHGVENRTKRGLRFGIGGGKVWVVGLPHLLHALLHLF